LMVLWLLIEDAFLEAHTSTKSPLFAGISFRNHVPSLLLLFRPGSPQGASVFRPSISLFLNGYLRLHRLRAIRAKTLLEMYSQSVRHRSSTFAFRFLIKAPASATSSIILFEFFFFPLGYLVPVLLVGILLSAVLDGYLFSSILPSGCSSIESPVY